MTSITNRNIVDNVIISYEIVHIMRVMGGKKGWKVVKIHLEKAYDKLKWKFIEDTLGDTRFPQLLNQIIMSFTSKSSL